MDPLSLTAAILLLTEVIQEVILAACLAQVCHDSCVMGVLAKLAFFSLLIAVVPLGTLYSGNAGFLDPFLLPVVGQQALETNRLLLAGGLAVFSVNLVLALFLLSAWQEKLPPKNHKEE